MARGVGGGICAAQIVLPVLGILLSLAVLRFEGVVADTFIVGGGGGWQLPSESNVNYTLQASTFNFVVGDSVVFDYDPTDHSVLSVTEDAFNSCDTSGPLQTWDGPSQTLTIPLTEEKSWWFICGFPGHCNEGQAFTFTVGSGTASPPTSPTPPLPTNNNNTATNLAPVVSAVASVAVLTLLGLVSL